MGDEMGSQSPIAATPIVSNNESPTMGRLYRKATKPTPVTAGTKKRLLETLEQTFKTKQPHIIVSSGAQTTQYSPRAIAKAPRTTHGEPPRITSTSVHPPQLTQCQVSVGISTASTSSGYPEVRSPLIFTFPGEAPCQASISTLSTPRVAIGLQQMPTGLQRQ